MSTVLYALPGGSTVEIKIDPENGPVRRAEQKMPFTMADGRVVMARLLERGCDFPGQKMSSDERLRLIAVCLFEAREHTAALQREMTQPAEVVEVLEELWDGIKALGDDEDPAGCSGVICGVYEAMKAAEAVRE